jgi:hypothetical protein
MTSAEPPVIESWMREAIVDALLAVGCPREVAARLSTEVQLRWSADSWPGAGDGEWLLTLNGHGSSFGPDVDEWTWAAETVAMNVSNDNAEANDRQRRGEQGWESLWPLPDRPSRR